MAAITKMGNKFMNLISEKVTRKFGNLIPYLIHRKKVKKFKKAILEGSPSFNLLWQFADFVKYSEIIYFYNNSMKNTDMGIYSSNGYIPGENGFKVSTEDVVIVVKLYSDSNKVAIEIERKIGGCLKSSFTFKDENWETTPTGYDELLIDRIISIINNKMIALFDWCYNLKF